MLTACVTTPLPDEYERCINVLSNEVIKFEVSNATRERPEVCADFLVDPNGNCPTVITIDDVFGNRHFISGREIEYYECTTINNKDD